MAAHARAQGYGGIVLMLDEFLLWLAEKDRAEFVQAINNLNLIVDHTTGQRSVPVFAFVARQRNLQEFFPDLTDESRIYEHIDHHAKRFEVSTLQDIELRHIVRGRILRPIDPAQVKAVTDTLAQKHERILPALLGGADIGYLRDVYPFHPALIEMLVDVTSLMQRERSALRLLYELLVLHYPNLPLGEFLPVGSAFQALFPPSGVEASKKVELMQDIHRQYYTRLAPAIQRLADDPNSGLVPERRRALDQMVKTVLLAEVSPRLRQGGLTIERLVQLNAVDVEGETFRGQVRVAETDLGALARSVPDLQIAGSDRTAIVRYVLGRVSLTEFLARARAKVDNISQRFKVFYPALKEALGITNASGFEEGGPQEGTWDLNWRRTSRKGQLKLCNIRETRQDAFEPPPGTFKVLIDYPWDEPGHGVEEDRHAAERVRRNRGTLYTVCWLPRHFTAQEMDVLVELAAVRFLVSGPGQKDLLDTLGAQDKSQVLEQASTRQRNLEAQLERLLKDVYIGHGEFLPLIDNIESRVPCETMKDNLEHIATRLMDRQYPHHPNFLGEPKKADLEALLGWMVEAGETAVSVAYDETAGRALRQLGVPLELVTLGQTRAQLRLDSRYIAEVLTRTDNDVVDWAPIAEYLRDTYGLQPHVVDLFLCFLCQRSHRALQASTLEPIQTQIGMSPTTQIRLQRGNLVEAPAWGRLRDLGNMLFNEPRPSNHRSLQIQDRLAEALRTHARARREVIQGLHQRLVELGTASGDRLGELAEANTRLAPLTLPETDTSRLLTDFLAKWPDAASDPVLVAVQQAEKVLGALTFLNGQAHRSLVTGKDHPVLGQDFQGHLQDLMEHLSGSQAIHPITKDWVLAWNQKAEALTHKLIELASVQLPPPPPPPPEPQPPQPPVVPIPIPGGPPSPKAPGILLQRRFDPTDADAVSDFLYQVRSQLEAEAGGPITLALVRMEDEG